MSYLVEKGFDVVKMEGLGRVLKCKLCGAIFVGATDAERHLIRYHRIVSTYRLEQVLSRGWQR